MCRGDLGGCGEVLQRQIQQMPGVGGEKFGRGPTNAAVFRNNLGSTSKTNNGEKGPEPIHIHALAQVYGNRTGTKLGSLLLTKSCPNCGQQNHIKMFGDQVQCEKCESGLADYVLRWMPNGNTATRFWSDLRVLQRWDPVEDDPGVKIAKEIFSQRLNGKMADEDAGRIGAVYMKTVHHILNQQRRDSKQIFEGLLNSILSIEGIKA